MVFFFYPRWSIIDILLVPLLVNAETFVCIGGVLQSLVDASTTAYKRQLSHLQSAALSLGASPLYSAVMHDVDSQSEHLNSSISMTAAKTTTTTNTTTATATKSTTATTTATNTMTSTTTTTTTTNGMTTDTNNNLITAAPSHTTTTTSTTNGTPHPSSPSKSRKKRKRDSDESMDMSGSHTATSYENERQKGRGRERKETKEAGGQESSQDTETDIPQAGRHRVLKATPGATLGVPESPVRIPFKPLLP
jgi:hypothetical protein